ncbi:MAG: hypothetical protein WDA14_05855 [Sphaerochaetaceae bacterium]
MKPIAIAFSHRLKQHSTSWRPVFTKYLENKKIPYELVDCYSYDIIKKLGDYSALIWGYSNFLNADLMEARNILRIAEDQGLKTFPNQKTGWHFDDKIAEMYALQSIHAEIPMSWVFYFLEDCIQWLESQAEYPIIAKLRNGSGANNVKMLKSKSEAMHYARRMFSKGFHPAPSLLYKTYSKVQSTHDLATLFSRIKRIPEFLRTRKNAQMMPIERGYSYFQEHIPNDGFDIKVAVVGDKLSYLCRNVRKNDFRASGGGSIYYDNNVMTAQIIDSAFKTSDDLKLQCVGFDYVVDNQTGKGKIIEMCYGFDHTAILGAGGYFDRGHIWHETPLNVPEEVLANLLFDE